MCHVSKFLSTTCEHQMSLNKILRKGTCLYSFCWRHGGAYPAKLYSTKSAKPESGKQESDKTKIKTMLNRALLNWNLLQHHSFDELAPFSSDKIQAKILDLGYGGAHFIRGNHSHNIAPRRG